MTKSKSKNIMIKGIIIGILGIASFLLSNNYNKFDTTEKEQAIIYTVQAMVDYVHFSPKKIDDDFSKQFYADYIKNLDGMKRFLTQEDIDKLKQYETNLDDEILHQNLEFFDLSNTLINNAIDKTENFYEELLDKPFDFSADDEVELAPEKRTWAQDDAELKEQWRKFFKYDVLVRVINKLEEQKKQAKDSTETKEIKTFAELEKESREKVKERYKDVFKRFGKIERADRFEVYVNSFANLFDPHTEYFSPKDKEDFDIRMGGKLEGIGARLQTDGDFTKIINIIPGGPAWKGKELEENDLILKVAQENSDEYVDLTGMRIDKVVTYIRGKKGTKVKLEVKKPDGTIKVIEITRDEVIIEEGKAKSAIVGYKINDKDNEIASLNGNPPVSTDSMTVIDNIGFIRLPSFYSDFKSRDGENCSKDIKKELSKLKDKHVKGIILDLRSNGGGSLRDVITMGGFFIKDGPIVQVKPGKEEPYVHSDNDRSVEYDGPLVILVNEMSASASEILAAAMQDYKRAVIVGSKATFGKGTVQRFFDLDNIRRISDDIKPLGNLKVTTQKFYRINGGSTQLKGVESDIVLPDRYQYMDVGERDYDHALPWDKIPSLDYSQNVFRLNHLDEIVNRSQERIEKDSAFIYINENARKIKEYSDKTLVPINIDKYNQWKETRKKEDEHFKGKLNTVIPGISVKNLEVDLLHIQMDSSRIGRNENWLKNIKKDQNVKEAILVIKDILELEKK